MQEKNTGRAVGRFLLSACAPNASLLLAKAVLRYGFRSVQGLTCHANPAGVAAFHSNQLEITLSE